MKRYIKSSTDEMLEYARKLFRENRILVIYNGTEDDRVKNIIDKLIYNGIFPDLKEVTTDYKNWLVMDGLYEYVSECADPRIEKYVVGFPDCVLAVVDGPTDKPLFLETYVAEYEYDCTTSSSWEPEYKSVEYEVTGYLSFDDGYSEFLYYTEDFIDEFGYLLD